MKTVQLRDLWAYNLEPTDQRDIILSQLPARYGYIHHIEGIPRRLCDCGCSVSSITVDK